MRRFLMLLVAMLALGAVSAPAASAINSDFPRGDNFPFPDTDAEDWVLAEIKDSAGESCMGGCTFEAETTGENGWYWQGKNGSTISGETCNDATLGGYVYDGVLWMTDAGWTQGSHPIGYFGFCYYLQPDASAMAGEICAHVETGEVWVRQSIALDGPYSTYYGSGTTFGRVADDGEEFSSLTFGGPNAVDTELGVQGGVDYDFKHRVEFAVDGPEGPYEVAVPESQEERPCSWAELS